MHARIEIDEKLLDIAGNLAADLNILHRIQRPRRRDRLRDWAAGGRRCLERRARATRASAKQKRDGNQGDSRDGEWDRSF